MPKECIICDDFNGILFRNRSKMKLPINLCQRCRLYYLLCEDATIREFNKKYYSKNYWSCFRKKYTKRFLLNFVIGVLRFLKTKPLLQSWHYRLMKIYLPKKKKIRFLDIGCGDGESLKFFSKRGFDVYGVEMDKNKTREINKYFNKSMCLGGT